MDFVNSFEISCLRQEILLNRKNQYFCVLDYYENLSKAVDIEKQKAQNALQNNDKVRISEETL